MCFGCNPDGAYSTATEDKDSGKDVSEMKHTGTLLAHSHHIYFISMGITFCTPNSTTTARRTVLQQ
jgi:hypothetical protein